jgi:Ca-activated chloride channel family protein
MSISSWLSTPRIRRGLAASAVVLATGGLVLVRADARQSSPVFDSVDHALSGSNSTSFAGPGVHGTFALGSGKVLAGSDQQLFAVANVVADPSQGAHERAPLAMAVVLDTSGSMDGEKIERAREAVVELVQGMRDDDEVAFVRYSDSAELVQSLSRVGRVRQSLVDRVRGIQAGGGTSIPRGLDAGLDALREAGGGRVRRVVLLSDGLDDSRVESERLASTAFERGITISSMGIGLDFNEFYMGSVARVGHGNFAFVKDASTLASFLTRELQQTEATTVADMAVELRLPAGVRFVNAVGADARTTGAASVELRLGSLFAGSERRVVVELATTLDNSARVKLDGNASWRRVGGGAESAAIAALDLVATNDANAVAASGDGTVLAAATSVAASRRELEAAEAYEQGDRHRADSLIQMNLDALSKARAAAPAPAASALDKQWHAYADTKKEFAAAKPASTAAKAAPKAAAMKDLENSSRSAF